MMVCYKYWGPALTRRSSKPHYISHPTLLPATALPRWKPKPGLLLCGTRSTTPYGVEGKKSHSTPLPGNRPEISSYLFRGRYLRIFSDFFLDYPLDKSEKVRCVLFFSAIFETVGDRQVFTSQIWCVSPGFVFATHVSTDSRRFFVV